MQVRRRIKLYISPLLLFLFVPPMFAVFEDNMTEKFSAREKFNHLTVHDYTEKVYIGAVNRIYQLSRDLKLEAIAVMGPQEDSPKCPVTRICPNEAKRPTTRPWSSTIPKSVVANNSTASTVAFIAQGPKTLPRMHVLYVGVSYTGNGPYRSDVPAVSSRSLDPNMFAIAHTGMTTGTKVMVNNMSREIYPITYVYGFSSKGFSYFVTVQKKFTDPPKPFISKLIRICHEDVHYYSYTEVPLVCRAPDYNLAQAAYVGRPGSELAVSLGITAQDVLFAVFAKSKDESDIYNKPSPNSALCVYALSAVHRKLTQNIQHCFNGFGDRGLPSISRGESYSYKYIFQYNRILNARYQ
ncbi:hypothetical protein TNCV_433151 [Trichonephila clavipes]|nr:hypothetical protein TNCV_433151 [Trichonephila clavipes]